MAKATRHSGDSYTEHELSDPDAPVRVRRAELGVVDRPSVGTNSSASSKIEQSENESQNPSLQEPARTMGNPSPVQEQAPDSIADSTDGDGRKTPSQQSVKRSAPAKRTARARVVNNADDDFDTF